MVHKEGLIGLLVVLERTYSRQSYLMLLKINQDRPVLVMALWFNSSTARNCT